MADKNGHGARENGMSAAANALVFPDLEAGSSGAGTARGLV